jgi:hypothetical protein
VGYVGHNAAAQMIKLSMGYQLFGTGAIPYLVQILTKDTVQVLLRIHETVQ